MRGFLKSQADLCFLYSFSAEMAAIAGTPPPQAERMSMLRIVFSGCGLLQRKFWKLMTPSGFVDSRPTFASFGRTTPWRSMRNLTGFNTEPNSLNARRKHRTINMVEFQNKELKKRTRCIIVFSNKESLHRSATALLIELDEKWLANGKVYLKV